MPEEQEKTRLWPEIVYVDKRGAAKATKSLDLPFREGFGLGLVASQARYVDTVLAQAGLPEPSEWAKILAVQGNIPSVRRLIEPSQLEMNAAVLFTTLAFSPQGQWRAIIKKFFKECGLETSIPRGRPLLSPSKVTALTCGKLIEEAQAKLSHGFAIKTAAKERGGFNSGDDEIAEKLRACGYDNQRITVILGAASEADAACRYIATILGRKPKTIQNIFSDYKKLLKKRI